jgi:Fe-S cluster biogenesis protein NfuA
MANFKLENTPNPNTIKVISDTLLFAGTIEYQKIRGSSSEFALALFEIEGLESVFILKDFMTITKKSESSFSAITAKALEVLNTYLSNGIGLGERPVEKVEQNFSDVEKKILDVLDKYIRPAVAQDGGDVSFHEFKEGTLYVKMIGSCNGCPSSTATLKGGIERMMQNMVPEVHTVESV